MTYGTITPEQAQEIAERQAYKSRILHESRAQRVDAYQNRHSHIGVEIGRDLKDLDHMAKYYGQFVGLAADLKSQGFTNASNIAASLAAGIARAGVELYGTEVNARFGEAIPVTNLAQEMASAGVSPDYFAEIIRTVASAEPFPSDASDYPNTPEGGISLEPALSPEPIDSPQREAARLRREQRAQEREARRQQRIASKAARNQIDPSVETS